MSGGPARAARTALAATALAVLGAAPAAMAGGASAAAPARIAVAGAASLPAGARTQGPVSPGRRVSFAIALAPRDPAALAELAREVSTPGSGNFRHYLTVSAFAARFGASAAQVAAVRSALAAHGLQAGPPSPNGLQLDVSGTAGQAEAAFGSRLAQVRLPGGAQVPANPASLTLPAGVAADVQAVVGLDGVAAAQSQVATTPARGARLRLSPAKGGRAGGQSVQSWLARRRPARQAIGPAGVSPCPAATAAATSHLPGQAGYTAATLASAYQFGALYATGDFGQGQTVAVFEQEGFNPSDIAAYQACYGTSASVTTINVDGGPPAGGSDIEAALDIETVIGLAPQARILVYQGPGSAGASLDVLNAIVSQDQARVISSSYGLCEALAGPQLLAAQDTVLQEAAVQGQSFVAASGDSGSAMCYQSQPTNRSLSVITPGADPYATGVGGTALYTNGAGGSIGTYSAGQTPSEGVWNDGTHNSQASASGGGISAHFQMPGYQSGAAPSVGVARGASGGPCGSGRLCREVPDVAADADPTTGYVVRFNGSWGIVGGTSGAAPLWAAFVALTNADAPCRGIPVGFLNPALYQLSGSGRYGADFTDTVRANPFTGLAGNNPFSGGGLYPVQSGYDMATGLGSMVGWSLAADLCSFVAPRFTVSLAAPAAQATQDGTPVSVAISAHDSYPGAALSYTAGGLPPGLAINPSSGTISGTPGTAGRYLVTVTAADLYGDAASARFAWTVVRSGAAPARGGRLRPDQGWRARLESTGRRLRLRLIRGGGRRTAAVAWLSVTPPRGMRFTGAGRGLGRSVTVESNGHRVAFRAWLRAGVLRLRLRTPAASLTITVAPPLLRVRAPVAAVARRRRGARRLSLTLRVRSGQRTTRQRVALGA